MKVLTRYAREHRKNPTPAEKELRRKLLHWGIRFRAQRQIDWFIVDFLIFERWLIVEVDGGYHEGRKPADEQRMKYLRSKGYSLIRFPNRVVFEEPERIRKAIEEFAFKPAPPAKEWWKLYGRAKY